MYHALTDYVADKKYVAIYVHNFFDAFGKSLVSLFSAVLLYQNGFPLHTILLFFALQFGVMGLLSPLSPVLVKTCGLAWTVLISNIFRLIGTVILLRPDATSEYLFFIFLLFAIDGAIYHPLINGVNAAHVADAHKGRVNSLNTIIKAISIMAAVSLASYLLSIGGEYILIMTIAGALALSIVPYALMLGTTPLHTNGGFVQTYRFLMSADFRENIAPFSLQTFLIIERLLIPLFIFIVVGSLQAVAAAVMIAITLELSITLLFGSSIDRFAKKAFFSATLLKSGTSLLFSFATFSIGWVFVSQTYAKVTENIFENSFNTLIQKKALKHDPILFIAAKEMTLCFSEFFALLGLAGLAYFIDEKIFFVIFFFSFVAIWVIYRRWSA